MKNSEAYSSLETVSSDYQIVTVKFEFESKLAET